MFWRLVIFINPSHNILCSRPSSRYFLSHDPQALTRVWRKMVMRVA